MQVYGNYSSGQRREDNMKTQPQKAEHAECPMNHGQFYRSADLVAAVHRDAGGIFAGFRAAHAFGRIYAGTFTPTPAAKALSRAAHFQGTPVPVTARLSGANRPPREEGLEHRRNGDEVLFAGRH